MNLVDLTPPAELVSLASQTPTMREKAGTESLLQTLLAAHTKAVVAAVSELRAAIAQELIITAVNIGWNEKTVAQLEQELDEIDERVGLNDPDSVKSWELADKELTNQEILKANIGRKWNKSEIFCSKMSEMLDTADAWVKRAGYYASSTDATNDATFFLFRERALFAEADAYRKRLQRIYNRGEQCVIVLQSLAGRKFSAAKYSLEMPRLDNAGYETIAKGPL
jgi:hypothetical protein